MIDIRMRNQAFAPRPARPRRQAAFGRHVSESMLERAQQVAGRRLDNVRYELGDARTSLKPGFDGDQPLNSCFLRSRRSPTSPPPFDPEPRWHSSGSEGAQRMGANDLPQRRGAQHRSQAPDPFLGDLAHEHPRGAGFDEVRPRKSTEPVLYGHDLDAALAFVRGFETRARPAGSATASGLPPSSVWALATLATSAAWYSINTFSLITH